MFENENHKEAATWFFDLYVDWRTTKTNNQRRYIIRQIKKKGYKITPNGQIEHRVIYEKAYGRIKKNWVIHHINGKKDDNDLKNLIAMPREAHDALHRYMREKRCSLTRIPTEAFLRGFLEAQNIIYKDD